jgi:hypothetical protein
LLAAAGLPLGVWVAAWCLVRKREQGSRTPSLGFDDLVADGVVDEFGEGVEVELEHDVGAVGFGGVHGDAEEVGDFLVGFAFGKELEDFAFAGSEAGACNFCAVRRGEFFGGAGTGDARGKIRLVVAGGVDGSEKHAVGFVFENIAAGAGVDDLLHKIVGLMHGEDENLGGGTGGANAARGFDAVKQRHADVEDGDVGFELCGFVDRVATVGSFGYDFPVGTRFEKRAKAGTDDGMVIRDQNA